MAADISAVRRKLDLYYGKTLPSGIGLFEAGAPGDASTTDSFIMRINWQVFVRTIPPKGRVRPHLVTAITTGGRLGLHAELIVFGTWMIRDAMPGSTKRPGKAPDLRKLFKVAAVAFAATTRTPANKRIASKTIVKFWKHCFDETTATADHSASLRSLRKIVPEYLAHLKARRLEFNGMKVTASPQMSKLAKALEMPASVSAPNATQISATVSTQTGSPATPGVIVAAPDVVAPTAFEIPLCYSSPNAEVEYRNTAASAAPSVPSLSYTILPVQATSGEHKVRADRVGKVMFKPDVDVIEMIKLEALIDRIALTFTTKRLTSSKVLWNAIAKQVDTAVYVADRTIQSEGQGDWNTCLPELDGTKLTGQHFVMLVQEPTPTNLRVVLNIIEGIAGIEGELRPCLLELAVDFYARDLEDPVAALMTRERIVGLVQRHHWSAGSGFLAHEPKVPREVDARQVYSASGKTHTRYLLPDAADKFHSDAQLKEPSVRQRLLNMKPGNDLYLNATIYRGETTSPQRNNVQHKIADRRNTANGTSVELANTQRRARVEMTLSSLDALEKGGLKTIDDLARCSFRIMSRNMLSFRLPTCEADSVAIEEAIKQMRTRGVYGVEMNQRAKVHEHREGMRPKPRKTDRDGWALMDWPEMSGMVGAALDRLQKGWRRF